MVLHNIPKAKKLVGENIEFVPWYQKFRKDTTMRGKLIRIRGAMAGKRGRPARWLEPAKRPSGMLVKIKTAATADVWAILKPKKRKKEKK